MLRLIHVSCLNTSRAYIGFIDVEPGQNFNNLLVNSRLVMDIYIVLNTSRAYIGFIDVEPGQNFNNL